jgi:hypothetical protein
LVVFPSDPQSVCLPPQRPGVLIFSASAGSRQEQDEGQVTVAARAGPVASMIRIMQQARGKDMLRIRYHHRGTSRPLR